MSSSTRVFISSGLQGRGARRERMQDKVGIGGEGAFRAAGYARLHQLRPARKGREGRMIRCRTREGG